MKVKKKRLLAILLLFAILGTGCGRELTEEPGIWESDNTKELQTENSEEIRSDDETEQETEQEILGDLEEWENKGERHQYIWGIWVVKAVWYGSHWSDYDDEIDCNDETDLKDWVGGVMELSPDHYTYSDQIQNFSVEIKKYYAASQPLRAAQRGDNLGLTINYCLPIEPIPDSHDKFGPFSHFYLTGKEQMLAYSGRALFRLEKIEDYEEQVEGADFTVTANGMEDGEWEVTEILKASQQGAEKYIGERLDTCIPYTEDKAETYQSIYLLDVKEKSIQRLVEAMGLEEEPFVICFDFVDGFYWDKMIIKDEMTVVLVKDGNYFWARRVSEAYEEYGI